jgi:hypothetical protein
LEVIGFINYIVKRIGIFLLVFIMLTPSWAVAVHDTNNNTSQIKNQNKKHNVNMSILNNLKKTKNSTDKIYQNKQPPKQVETSKNINKPVETNKIGHLKVANGKSTKVVQHENGSENRVNLTAIAEMYDQILSKFNFLDDSLKEMNALKNDLKTNRTNLEDSENSLENEINNYVLNMNNKEEYDNLCFKLNDTKEKIRTVNQVQNHVITIITDLEQKKNDYNTVLAVLNQSKKEGKITSQEINTIQTVAQKYNQTIPETTNTSENTNTTNNNETTIQTTDPQNNNPDNTDTQPQLANHDIFYGVLTGLNALAYGELVGIQLWKIHLNWALSGDIFGYVKKRLYQLREAKNSEASPAIPSEASKSNNVPIPQTQLGQIEQQIMQLKQSEITLRTAKDNLIQRCETINANLANAEAKGDAELVLKYKQQLRVTNAQIEEINDNLDGISASIRESEEIKSILPPEAPNIVLPESPDVISPVEVIDMEDIGQVTRAVTKNVFTYPKFANLDMSEKSKIALVEDEFITPFLKDSNKLLSDLRGKNMDILTEFQAGEYALGRETTGQSALNELLLLKSAQGEEKFDSFVGLLSNTGKVLDGTRDVKLCLTGRSVLYSGEILGVISVVLDLYAVASIVSWAGAYFGWWKRDYVNEWMPF